MGLSGCIFLVCGWVKPTSPTWCSFPKAANAEVVLVYKYRVYSLNQLQPLLEQGHPELVARTMSGWLLNISKDRDCTASLGSLLQRLTTLAVKKGDFSLATSRTKQLELSGQQQGSQSQGKTWITAESFNGAAFLPVYPLKWLALNFSLSFFAAASPSSGVSPLRCLFFPRPQCACLFLCISKYTYQVSWMKSQSSTCGYLC